MNKPNHEFRSVFSSRKLALKLALAYVVFCSTYILVSSHIVSKWAGDVAQLACFEQVKGLVFVFVTGLLFYVFACRLFLRIERQAHELAQNEHALVRAERRSLAATLASSVAHDMKNMLTVLSGGISLLVERDESSDRSVALHMMKAIDDMANLSNRLMVMGRETFGVESQEIDVLEHIQKAVDFAKTHYRVRGCDIRVSGAGGVRILASPRQLGAMTLNLLINAADASKPGEGRIYIIVQPAKAGGVDIEYHDNGPGLPAAVLEHMFTPFITTKPDGTGLGLLSVKVVAEDHRGSVMYERSTQLGGACFRVHLVGIKE